MWPQSCKYESIIKINYRHGLQSPINIIEPYVKTDKEIEINFNSLTGVSMISNDGFKITFLNDNIGSVRYDSVDYKAKRIELHNPSEHTVKLNIYFKIGNDETRSPMELQVICESDDKKILAISVLFEYTENENEILTIIGLGVNNPAIGLKLRNSENVLVNHDNIRFNIDLGKHFNNKKKYVSYTGSLTSSPCTQDVKWIILMDKFETSRSQVNYFPVLFGRKTNIRGLQPFKGREILAN
jgi:carbonic anhydrase